MAGVKFIWNPPDGGYLDAFRQSATQGVEQIGAGILPRSVEMKNLALGMDAAVGAPAAVDAYGLAAKNFQTVFENILDGVAAGLALPSVKARSIVSHCAFPSHLIGSNLGKMERKGQGA